MQNRLEICNVSNKINWVNACEGSFSTGSFVQNRGSERYFAQILRNIFSAGCI